MRLPGRALPTLDGAAAATPARDGLLLSAALLALPLAGLALLVGEPDLDVRWEHHPAHFWLVLAAGGLNAGLAYATGVAARRRPELGPAVAVSRRDLLLARPRASRLLLPRHG